ncbi:MAG: 23S rRNA (pseudouridine(1915)-N(3))-methyltransferase RlmH [Proteobacteria bacterium]|nr:23S rRNA (pseudouridine(1915)-N(3))-methyltransferase RlmH [Pseudomonadota bacterium]
MKIRLLAVGHKMPTWVQQTFNQYNHRLPKIQQVELVEIAAIHRGKTSNSEKAKQQEGDNILTALKPQEKLITLDEHGQSISTQALAHAINSWQMDALNIAILIGGADGITEDIKQKSYKIWSLSQLTFPHPLVRVIIMEQIYRAYSINANHPYHRE